MFHYFMHLHRTMTPAEIERLWGGSLASVGGGVFAAAVAPDGSMSMAGLVMAAAGLVTASAGLIVPLVRIWADVQKAERDRKTADHGLADALNVANLRITDLEMQRERNTELITWLMTHAAEAPPGKPIRPPEDLVIPPVSPDSPGPH